MYSAGRSPRDWWIFALIAISLVLIIASGLAARAAEVPAMQGRITDPSHLLKPADLEALARKSKAIEDRHPGTQVFALLMPGKIDEPIEQFNLRVARQWGIGVKGLNMEGANRGVLFTVFTGGQMRIDVGTGADMSVGTYDQPAVTGAAKPYFAKGDWAGGLNAYYDRTAAIFDASTAPEAARPGTSMRPTQTTGRSASIVLLAVAAIVMVLIIAAMLALKSYVRQRRALQREEAEAAQALARRRAQARATAPGYFRTPEDIRSDIDRRAASTSTRQTPSVGTAAAVAAGAGLTAGVLAAQRQQELNERARVEREDAARRQGERARADAARREREQSRQDAERAAREQREEARRRRQDDDSGIGDALGGFVAGAALGSLFGGGNSSVGSSKSSDNDVSTGGGDFGGSGFSDSFGGDSGGGGGGGD